MVKESFYEILEINPKATEAEIKSAYRELAKKYHPDLNHTTEAAKKFKELHQAYAVLSNTFERKIYDESLNSHKLPKDVFTQPKTSTTTARPPTNQTTTVRPSYTTTKDKAEELRKQAEIRKYRQFLIKQAILKIILNALMTLGVGYALISVLQMIERQTVLIQFFSLEQIGGMLSGMLLGLIWSIDRYFKIETFISKLNYRKMFRHFRTATFALAFSYLFAFAWGRLTPFNLEQNLGLTASVFALLFLITTTFASDGEMRTRFEGGKFLEILVIFWHNFMIGIGGILLGIIVGMIFYLIDPRQELIYFSVLFGYVFAILWGSVAPQDLDLITHKINQMTRSLIYVIVSFVLFLVGIGVGFFLEKVKF